MQDQLLQVLIQGIPHQVLVQRIQHQVQVVNVIHITGNEDKVFK
nr:hypothetical protein [Tanacetum cinerariifolium]